MLIARGEECNREFLSWNNEQLTKVVAGTYTGPTLIHVKGVDWLAPEKVR